MTVPERFSGNLGAFTETEINNMAEKSACVVGCGGLGGYVINCLARFGVGNLTLIDGDDFSESNFNRQLFATAHSLGKNKAFACKDMLANAGIHSAVEAQPVMLLPENADELVAGHDIVMDCLDNIQSRRLLADVCERLEIPLVHGAISGLYGQVASIFPGDRLFDVLYPTDDPVSLGNPVFAPQLVASIQGCEAVKILVGRSPGLQNRVLYIDMQNNDFEIFSFS